MSFIRTVLGDISPAELGVCYSHEHIIIDPSYATDQNPDFLLDDVEKAVADLKGLKGLGVKAFIDSMPCDCGRNAWKLASVAFQAQVHIVCPTGLHLRKYYDSGHWSRQLWRADWPEIDWLAQLFIADIEEGIDSNDYGAPFINRGAFKAGLVKVAASETWDERTEAIFGAAAVAQQKTGAPILTHTENGQLALEQARFLEESGADLGHVVLSHLDRNPDANYHREVLQTGVTIEYDSHFRWKTTPNPALDLFRRKTTPNPTLELLKQLLPEFPDQIVLGMDAARRSYWKSYGGAPGMGYLYGDFRLQMREAGIGDELIDKVFVSTPARVYAFKEKTEEKL